MEHQPEQMRKTSPLFTVQVKKRLIDLNMTQRELAAQIGINENYLSDVLNGRRSGKKYKPSIILQLGLEDSRLE